MRLGPLIVLILMVTCGILSIVMNLVTIPKLHTGCKVWNCTFIVHHGHNEFYDAYMVSGNETVSCKFYYDKVVTNGTCYEDRGDKGHCPIVFGCTNEEAWGALMAGNAILVMIFLSLLLVFLNMVFRRSEYETLYDPEERGQSGEK